MSFELSPSEKERMYGNELATIEALTSLRLRPLRYDFENGELLLGDEPVTAEEITEYKTGMFDSPTIRSPQKVENAMIGMAGQLFLRKEVFTKTSYLLETDEDKLEEIVEQTVQAMKQTFAELMPDVEEDELSDGFLPGFDVFISGNEGVPTLATSGQACYLQPKGVDEHYGLLSVQEYKYHNIDHWDNQLARAQKASLITGLAAYAELLEA